VIIRFISGRIARSCIFFGLDFQNLAGIIDVDSGEEYILGNDASMEDIIWMGPQVSLKERAEQVGISCVEPFGQLLKRIDQAIALGRKIHFLPPYRAENNCCCANF
jgi:Xaa-Pro aminopeptidase